MAQDGGEGSGETGQMVEAATERDIKPAEERRLLS
jgi:hypothetical protein